MANEAFLRRELARAAVWLATAPARRRSPLRSGATRVDVRAGDGVRLRAWLMDVERARGTVVLGHGYRDDSRQLAGLIEPLAAVGLRTAAFDFRAHGRSDGSRITIGVDEERDVAGALDWAATLGGPVGYVGFSMGAAAYLLSKREADAAVLDSPYDTLLTAVEARLTRFRVPRDLADAIVRAGSSRLLRDEGRTLDGVRPIDAVAHLTRPTLLLFATDDGWISAATRERFRRALSPSCRMEELAGGHADHFDPGWYARVADFLGAA